MKVKDVMSTSLVTVTPTAPFREVWKLIFKRKVNALPVVDKNNKLLGIVAKESLLDRLYPDYKELFSFQDDFPDFEDMESKILELGSLTAEDIMAKRLVYTREDTPVMRALSRMIVRRLSQLPVLSDSGILVGLITKGDIFYAMFKTYMKRIPRPRHQEKKSKK